MKRNQSTMIKKARNQKQKIKKQVYPKKPQERKNWEKMENSAIRLESI